MPKGYYIPPAGGSPTKQFSIMGHASDYSPMMHFTAEEIVDFWFRCPADFTSISNLIFRYVPQGDEVNAAYDVDIAAGQCDENEETHTDSDSWTNNDNVDINECKDLNTLQNIDLSFLTAGDWVHVRITFNSSGTKYYPTLDVKYT